MITTSASDTASAADAAMRDSGRPSAFDRCGNEIEARYDISGRDEIDSHGPPIFPRPMNPIFSFMLTSLCLNCS